MENPAMGMDNIIFLENLEWFDDTGKALVQRPTHEHAHSAQDKGNEDRFRIHGNRKRRMDHAKHGVDAGKQDYEGQRFLFQSLEGEQQLLQEEAERQHQRHIE